MIVVVLEDAADDIEGGRRFYDSSEGGVGNYFVDSIISDLASLTIHAGIHRVDSGFHLMLSRRFPFGIYYKLEDEAALVYAVLDMPRHPLWIRHELERRQ